MKLRTLFSSLLWVAVCLPLSAQTPSWQPSRPVIPAEAELTEEERSFFQEVMNRLVEIGLWERAKRMEGDLAAGRISIYEDEPGVRASTAWHLFSPNTMEIPSETMGQWLSMRRDAKKLRAKGREDMARTRESDMRLHLLDVALTVDHEYVHMNQARPSENTESENPAWRRRIDQENRIIRELSDRIAKLLAAGALSDSDLQMLAALKEDLRDIDEVHYGTIHNDLPARIQDGSLTASLFDNDIKTLEAAHADLVKVLQQVDEALVPRAVPLPAMMAVPSVQGMTPEAASAALQSAGFTPASLPIQGEVKNVKARVVFEQEPKAGTMLPPTSAVKFYFSLSGSGKVAALKVPDLAKLSKTEAEAKLAELKFKVESKAGDKAPVRGNKKQEVYAQSPQAGTEAKEGDVVKFTYLAGIPVGRYVGLNKDEAAKVIVEAGLKPKVAEGDNMTANEAQQFNIYAQSPAAGEYVWFDDEVSVQHYKLVAGGFQDGDGNEVEAARVGNAKVYSEGDRELAQYPGASGKRCAILLTPPRSTNMMAASESWSVVKFSDAAAAKAFYQQMAGPMTANQNLAGHREWLEKVDGGVAYSRHMNMRGIKSSDHIRISIYRDVFVIMYFMHKPEAAASMAHGPAIMKKSKDLVDMRFPKS